ncbi:peroxisome biogenesis factor 1 isoform X2 [Venturia canescens]|uniref:peroxisome biogenesis factor 1 isoform X2 n=1 Tax=Venturia canescens TaxID=32260 RepID=UPI001C9C6ABF|nr:peroxisome biogenesis factor 1 isoform X2 [Venturia canescens]
MHEERLTVKYTSSKNCFVHLPETLVRRLDSQVTGLKLSHNNDEYYVSWRSISGLDDSLRISATFARSLNIKEGNEVIVSSISNPPFLSSITVTPWNIEDWAIVEFQADRIQSVLLDQISLLAKKQPIVVWVSKGLSIILSVDEISPDFAYGRIGDRTEVHVEMPRDRKTFPKSVPTVDNFKFNLSHILNGIPLVKGISKREGIDGNPNDIQWYSKNIKNVALPEVFRVSDEASMKDFWTTDLLHSPDDCPYDVFVPECSAVKNLTSVQSSKSRLYKIRKIREDRQSLNAPSTNFLQTDSSAVPKQSTELIVRLFIVKSKNEENLQDKRSRSIMTSVHNKIYVSTNLRRNLNLAIGSKVLLETLPNVEQSATSIELFPSTRTITEQKFKEFLREKMYDNEILINSRSRVYFEEGTSCMVLCSPEQCSYSLIDDAHLKNIVVNVNNVAPDDAKNPSINDKEIKGIDLTAISIPPFQSIIKECQIVLELSLGLSNPQSFSYEPGNILICGDIGVGKTTVCKILEDFMRKSPRSVHVHTIECRALKGKRAEAMHKILSVAMADCIYHQPSILILDDLETITSSDSGEEETTPDAMNASRILDLVFNISAEFQSSHYVSIIATCTNINKIGLKLRSPRGVHLFRIVLTLPDLVKEHRIDILRLALQKHIHVPEAMNWDYYGNKTEGWVAQDLIDFAEKASFASWKRHVTNKCTESVTLTEEDLSETLKNYKTISLHGVQFYKNSGHDWSSIGGLDSVKEVLTQLLKWPMQYPELYCNAPIKNQNGVLLYGMPGTGKTILAGAIAKECGVNLISVKGPELLSKYIGASEEAVRNVFEKARRAKPCVLFFDEFDSLAPRRGHDSTGVTDRVVNQLLTQLDGVEGREGVAIVAASSRPDLLDPALLRPGRLDKSLLCSLPDEEEREQILKVLCEAQCIDTANLDLKNLAERSPGFTGADLSSVLTQAKYDALEDVLSSVLPFIIDGQLNHRLVIGQETLPQNHLLMPAFRVSFSPKKCELK